MNRFDIDAIIGYSKEQLNVFLNDKEQYIEDLELQAHKLTEEVIQADEQMVQYIRLIKSLETDIKHYKERLKDLEEVKIEQKASVSVWKAITGLAAAIGALLASIFYSKDD